MNNSSKIVLAFSLVLSSQTFSMLKLSKPLTQSSIVRKNLIKRTLIKRSMSTDYHEKLFSAREKAETKLLKAQTRLLNAKLGITLAGCYLFVVVMDSELPKRILEKNLPGIK